MIWLTWRQHRQQAVVAVLLLAALAALLVPSGRQMHRDFVDSGLGRCLLRSGRPAGLGLGLQPLDGVRLGAARRDRQRYGRRAQDPQRHPVDDVRDQGKRRARRNGEGFGEAGHGLWSVGRLAFPAPPRPPRFRFAKEKWPRLEGGRGQFAFEGRTPPAGRGLRLL